MACRPPRCQQLTQCLLRPTRGPSSECITIRRITAGGRTVTGIAVGCVTIITTGVTTTIGVIGIIITTDVTITTTIGDIGEDYSDTRDPCRLAGGALRVESLTDRLKRRLSFSIASRFWTKDAFGKKYDSRSVCLDFEFREVLADDQSATEIAGDLLGNALQHRVGGANPVMGQNKRLDPGLGRNLTDGIRARQRVL